MLASEQILIGGRNLTPYILSNTYKADRITEYEKWTDANGHEHRVPIRAYVEGEFEVCCRSDKLTLSNFIGWWKTATENEKTRIKLFVPNIDSYVESEFYSEITTEKHEKTNNGFVDWLKIKITEV